MALNGMDWTIVALFFTMSLIVGLVVAKRAGESSSNFFLSGRGMPWWLLGFLIDGSIIFLAWRALTES